MFVRVAAGAAWCHAVAGGGVVVAREFAGDATDDAAAAAEHAIDEAMWRVVFVRVGAGAAWCHAVAGDGGGVAHEFAGDTTAAGPRVLGGAAVEVARWQVVELATKD